jgi:hypothetical protein
MVEAGGRRGMLHITPRQIPRPQASQEPLAHSSCGMPVDHCMDPFRRVIVTVTPSLRLLVNIEPGSCERVRGRLKLTVTDLNFTGDWSLSRMMMLRLPLPGPSHSLAG